MKSILVISQPNQRCILPKKVETHKQHYHTPTKGDARSNWNCPVNVRESSPRKPEHTSRNQNCSQHSWREATFWKWPIFAIFFRQFDENPVCHTRHTPSKEDANGDTTECCSGFSFSPAISRSEDNDVSLNSCQLSKTASEDT